MPSETLPIAVPRRPAWNKGRIVGQKRPLAPKHVWSIRVRLEMADNKRDLALFNAAIDSKLTQLTKTRAEKWHFNRCDCSTCCLRGKGRASANPSCTVV